MNLWHIEYLFPCSCCIPYSNWTYSDFCLSIQWLKVCISIWWVRSIHYWQWAFMDACTSSWNLYHSSKMLLLVKLLVLHLIPMSRCAIMYSCCTFPCQDVQSYILAIFYHSTWNKGTRYFGPMLSKFMIDMFDWLKGWVKEGNKNCNNFHG